MFFRIWLPLFLTLALLTSACTEFMRGRQKKEEILDTQQTSCLKTMPAFINRYFDDLATEAEIDESFDCFQQSLKTFVQFTRGRVQDRYSDQEIQYFFNRYLLKENQISEAFLQELMRVKSFAVGGSRQEFTRAEINLFAVYLEKFRTEVKNLRGFAKLIFFREEASGTSQVKLKQAHEKMQASVERLVLDSKIASSDFEFQNIQSFMFGLDQFIGSGTKLSKVVKWFPLLTAAKELFLGAHASPTSLTEWKKSINWSVESYFLSLEYYYHAQHFKLASGEDWEPLLSYVDHLFDVLEMSPEMTSKNLIAAAKIDSLIDRMWELGIFKGGWTSKLLKSTYRKVIANFLENRKEQPVLGLEKRHLSRLKSEYAVWSYIQRKLVSPTNPEIKISSALEQGWREWESILNRPRPVIFTSESKLSIAYSKSLVKHTLSGLTLMNFFRSASRLVMQGYGDGEGIDFLQNSISEANLLKLEDDFKEQGEVLQIFDPNGKSAIRRTLKEGNFFTYSGNGDGRLSGWETFELLSFMYSAGVPVAQEIYAKVNKSGGLVSETDPLGRKKVDLKTLNVVLRREFCSVFSNLPSICTYVKQLSDLQWEEMFQSLVSASSRHGSVRQGLEYHEIQVLGSIVQYVESIFVQFDQDQNQGLSVAELRVAEERFHQFIKKVSGYKNEKLVREAFIYIVYQGKKPELTYQLSGYLWDRYVGGLGSASRLHLYEVLGILKADAN